MLMRMGVCGLAVLFLLSSTKSRADDPTEEQGEVRYYCNQMKEFAEDEQVSCNTAQGGAGAAKSAYDAADKSHLTPGEALQCATEYGEGNSSYGDGAVEKMNGITSLLDGNDERDSGDLAWLLGFYALACEHYDDGAYLYQEAACAYNLAESDFISAGECWTFAKERVDEALLNPNCLLCNCPDAQCECQN